MAAAIKLLEQQADWQFTGELDGELIVVMRGRKGAPFPNGFYTMEGGIPGKKVLADFFRRKFESDNLKVLRGTIPTDDNE